MVHINPRPIMNLQEYDQLLKLVLTCVQANRTEAVNIVSPSVEPMHRELTRDRASAAEDELLRFMAEMTHPDELRRVNQRAARNRRSADV